MGVHFKPGGAFPFLGFEADELRDCHANLDTILGRAAAPIHDRLCSTKSPAHRFHLLEQFLKSRLKRLERHSAVAFALATYTRAVADDAPTGS